MNFTNFPHRFVKHFFILILFCALDASSVNAEAAQLPVGKHSPALHYSHFPSRLHAVVFRNWNLVPTERIARTVGANATQIREIAKSMGLPASRCVAKRFEKQIYITVLRRNWHLLPYQQLLTLLNMTSGELAFALQEDDFLFIKLGSLKPKCTAVRYQKPNAKIQQSAKQFRIWLKKYFGDELNKAGEPRFAFIDKLSKPLPAEKKGASKKDSPKDKETSLQSEPRYIYSYFGIFGDPLLDAKLDPYPEGLLQRLNLRGVNGVWLHVVLRQLAPGGKDFPEFGKQHKTRIANLKKLVARAKRHHIKVYLYMNEPRSQSVDFFKSRPNMAGVRKGNHIAMCTSDPRVRKWMKQSLTYVFSSIPDLGGVFTITASENLTSCASHGLHSQCPRCKKLSAAKIIAQVNQTIEKGVHQGNPKAKVIVWDWGWNGHRLAKDHINLQPKNVYQMSVSEWSKPITRGGVMTKVGEYSLSAVGPGPRAVEHWKVAQQRGMKTIAKVQLNATWEMSAVPYLPVLDLVAQHCTNLRKANVNGMMLSWSVGGYPSANLQVAHRLFKNRELSADDCLNAIAVEQYGKAATVDARKAWSAFSKAFTEFPFHISVLYRGPQQLGPANLLYAKKTGYSATMLGFPYDHVDGWRGPYPSEVLASQFKKTATRWQIGLTAMQNVIKKADKDKKANASEDFHIAEAVQLHFASVANQIEFIHLRDKLASSKTSKQDAISLRRKMLSILDSEIKLARRLYTLTKYDSRIGFEASNQYYYTPIDLIEKVINCQHLKKGLSD